MKKLNLSQISLYLFALLLLPTLSNAQYSVTVSNSTYTELTGATQLTYSSIDDGYYYQYNYLFPVFDNRIANFNLDISNNSNGGFLTSKGYLAVYESPGYDNTVVFHCLYQSDLNTVANITKVSAKVEGTIGNRIAKFQWKNLVKGTDTTKKISFQAWLHEADNSVSYHYGPNSFGTNAVQGYCGIMIIDSAFTSLLRQCHAEGNPASPAVYDSITTFGLPTLDSIPANGLVITFSMVPTSVKEVPVAETFACYPNPTSDYLMVKSDSKQQVQLYNIYGQAINSIDINATEKRIDVSDLPKGIYILQSSGGYRKTFVVQ